ncbi:Polysaccharide deacetylase [Bradyrhizobium lablabi]|uniref:Chitooligosaccharide deacetylase n=1 Tax=Bradyrhizobium lablabi TaxID=722472 RepID=A0A1M6JBZ6_9BRAD|nr:Polysaccharide deacetylase [Bradyrhizobium lablabi]
MGGSVIVKPTTYITTSWDDGHPLDLRVAELLTKYGLRGTFYIPMTAENGTMTAAQLRELSLVFEIGAHTLHHTVLTGATEQQAWQEIVGSRSWLENNTGLPCLMFCPPEGKYSGRHLAIAKKAGYVGVRGVELLSLDFPRRQAGLMLMPTTIQAFPHRFLAFAKNAIKRKALANLWLYVIHGRAAEWPAMAESLLRHAIDRGGVFHLWGHSWELQDASQWQRLKDVLCLMGSFVREAPALTNGQLCRLSMPSVTVLDQAAQAAKTAAAGG